MLKTLFDWTTRHVHTRSAPYIFAGLVFIEGVLFMPVNTLLIIFGIEKRKQVFFYACIALLFSVLGGLFGYFVGSLLWTALGTHVTSYLISEETLNKAIHQYQSYEMWGIAVASFLPIPYKVITLTAGFCRLPLYNFVLGITLGRSIRFLSIAAALFLWGDRLKQIIDRYFYYLVALGVTIIIGGWLLVH